MRNTTPLAASDPLLDVDVCRISKGQLATYELGGRFVRQPVPSDGLLVETTSTSVFIPLDLVRAALPE